MDELQDLINERQFERDWYVYDLNIEDLDSLKNLKEFIKWLVKNDKIKDEEWQYLWSKDMQSRFSNTDILLMLLSIQENPIEFLLDIII